MKIVSSFLNVITAIVFLTSCNSSSSSSAQIKNPENGTCATEESLLNGIVGGNRIQQSDYDSKYVMMLNAFEGEKLHICTAAAIASDVLLTAAHCITNSAEDSFVTLYSGLSCESGFDLRKNTVKVSRFVVNEEFDQNLVAHKASKLKGDLALVFLKEDLPSDYPVYKIADPKKISKSALYFYGYGSVGYDKKGAGLLRKTQVSSLMYEILEDDKKIAVDQSNGAGVCTGDSGGPGLVNIDGELQILGVNSYVSNGDDQGDLCRNKSSLVLVDSYRGWIEKKMNQSGRDLRK